MSDGFAALIQFVDFNHSRFVQFLSLLMLPFAHEDIAIILGGYIVVNKLLPVGLVALSIYGGMVASDFALYGIGMGARRLPWLSRLAVDDRVRGFGETLRRNLFEVVALCRVVPGMVFIAFVACGWTRVPLARFTVASLVISALYLPLVFSLVLVFGEALDNRVGLWTWPFLGVALAAGAYARRQVFALRTTSEPATAKVALAGGFGGMPALTGRRRKVALAERIPRFFVYLPLVFTWIRFACRYRCLTLPSAANPKIPAGGMWASPKSDYFLDVAAGDRKWIADFVVMTRRSGLSTLYHDLDCALHSLDAAGLTFPLMAKPDIGCRGHGVRRIDNRAALRDYLRRFPGGARLILQRFVPDEGEAAVFYARLPGEDRGRILSLTFRYFPHVIGDGRHSVRALIYSDPRAQWKALLHLGYDPNHRGLAPSELERIPARGEVVQIALIGDQRVGGLYRDGRRFITSELETRIDIIARGMSEFHYGRFDLRFASVEELMRGEGISIVDIDGIGSEAIDAWDPLLSIAEAYRRLIDQQRIFFVIGERNRGRGVKPTGLAEFLKLLVRQNWLIRRYPASS